MDHVVKGSSRKFLRLTASAAAINAALYENLDFPAKTVPKFIAYAKANPGVINFGPGVSAEIDVLFADLAPKPTPEDIQPRTEPETVTHPGDLWVLNGHRLPCGNALAGSL
jgi:hypothetical protein